MHAHIPESLPKLFVASGVFLFHKVTAQDQANFIYKVSALSVDREYTIKKFQARHQDNIAWLSEKQFYSNFTQL